MPARPTALWQRRTTATSPAGGADLPRGGEHTQKDRVRANRTHRHAVRADDASARVPALRYATREEEFVQIFGAGVLLVLIGMLTYTLGEDWNVVDSIYFSVSTLTTTSVSDPDLVLNDGWLKLLTGFYR
jgi:hypothetical protein